MVSFTPAVILLIFVAAISSLLPNTGLIQGQGQGQDQTQHQDHLHNSSKILPSSLQTHIRALCVLNPNSINGYTKVKLSSYKHDLLKIDKAKLTSCILLLALSLSNDVQVNPGPVKFPCGLCKKSVRWNQRGVCCDSCDVWYHAKCLDMNTPSYEALQASHVCWICYTCGMPNFASSLFNSSSEIECSNSFSPLSPLEDASSVFTPLAMSSPTTGGGAKSKAKLPPSNNKGKAKAKQHCNRKIRAVVINFQGLRSKIESLTELIHSVNPDIIFGTETWANDSISNSELFPSHIDLYDIWRKDRKDSHGGVLIAVRKTLLAIPLPDLDADCEVLWAKIKFSGYRDIYLGAFYNPHHNDPRGLPGLEVSMSKLPPDAYKILAGDFNLPDINWESDSVKPSSARIYKSSEQSCNLLLDIACTHNLQQVVNFPTRQQNMLDLLFTSNHTLVDSVKPIPGISDHDSIIQVDLNASVKHQKTQAHKVYNYKKADFDKIRSELLAFSDVYFNNDPDALSVNQNWEALKSKLLYLKEKYIPSKMSSTRFNIPYITREIKCKIRQKHRVYNRARKSQSQEDWSLFRELRSQVQKSLRSSRWKYLNEVIGPSLKDKPKAFYQYVKRLRQDSTGIQQLYHKGCLRSSSQEKADILGSQFESVFTAEPDIPLPNILPSKYPSMADIIVQGNGVEKLLRGLDPSKSSGPDNIPAILLKETASEVSPILTHIYNQSLKTGVLPDDWKKAHIAPVFKKGDKTKAENYRPISLTSIACKTLEHILVSSIMKHLDTYSILSPCQHGFRRKYSCETQLLLAAHDLADSYRKKKQVDMIMLDFSKAFDKVPHNRLILKLRHYGIQDHNLIWIQNFLSNREQSVVLEGVKSKASPVISGVPQGTVLGPTLFLLYINDLPDQTSSTTRLFADDCMLYREINSSADARMLQKDLDVLQQWENTWLMSFNPGKCIVMRFCPSRYPVNYNYYIHNSLLQICESGKYLGVTLSNDFKWSSHISAISKKASQQLGFIRRNTRFLPQSFREAAYKSLVRPHLEYCCSVWDPHTISEIQTLERIQRQAARYVTADYRRTSSVSVMISKLKWPSLSSRRAVSRLTMVYRIMNNLVAIPPDTFFTINSSKTRKNHNMCFQTYRPRGNIDKFAFAQRTILEWNKLPSTVVNAVSLDQFKDLVTNHYESTHFD